MAPTREETKQIYKEIADKAAEQGEAATTQAIRKLMQEDLFFLLVFVLGRDDVDRDWLFDRCKEVQLDPDGYLDLWAREHFKSSIITFAKTIQDVICDPEITVGIFSHTRPIAKTFLRQIKIELESNAKLKRFFPEIFWDNPKSQAPKWSEDDGLIVKRQSNPKESTIEAWGLVDGQPTGRHYRLMVYDDVVTRESVTTPEMIKKVTEAWELSRNLTSADRGKTRYIGTRYSFNDTYREILARKAAIPRIYPGTDDGTPYGNPVLFSRELNAEKRREMGNFTYSCQILQNPRADEIHGFKRDWLKYWARVTLENMNKYILVDPASEKKKTSDYTAMWCIGLAPDKNYYVIDMVRDRLNLTERANLLFEWHQKYRPIDVGYEKYGMQSDIEHIEFLQEKLNYRFEVTPLAGSTGKIDRIRRLIPIFEQRRMYFPEYCVKTDYEGKSHDLVKVFIEEEYIPFPVMVHDDMLDGLSRIVDPKFTTIWPEVEIAPRVMTLAQRDWLHITGQDNAGAAYNLED